MGDTTLKQIREAALDSSRPISDVLRLCLTLGSEIDSDELKDWSRQELYGYKDQGEDAVPPYRKLSTELGGEFIVGYSRIKMDRLPKRLIPVELRPLVDETVTLESVRSLEHLVESAKAQGSYKLELACDPALSRYFNGTVYEGGTCYSISRWITTGQIEGLLDQVRNRVLELALALEEKMKKSGKEALDSSTFDRADVQKTVSIAIYGGNNQFAVASHEVEQKLKVEIARGDVAAAEEALEDAGVPREAIDELAEIVRAEPPTEGNRALGPRALAWVAKFATDTGTGVVAAIIAKLYGLS